MKVFFSILFFTYIMGGYAQAQSGIPSQVVDIEAAYEKGSDWLIRQYDNEKKVFGTGSDAENVETLAVCLSALCINPAHTIENFYISGPILHLLQQIDEKGFLKDPKSNETLAVGFALVSFRTLDEKKYKTAIESLQPFQLTLPLEKIISRSAKLNDPIQVDRLCLRTVLYNLNLKLSIEKQHEFARTVANQLISLQLKNGSFGDDIQINGLALNVLHSCIKTLKRTE